MRIWLGAVQDANEGGAVVILYAVARELMIVNHCNSQKRVRTGASDARHTAKRVQTGNTENTALVLQSRHEPQRTASNCRDARSIQRSSPTQRTHALLLLLLLQSSRSP